MVKIADLVTDGASKLGFVTDNPRGEARILLAHLLNTDVNHIIIHPDTEVGPDKKQLFDSYISMRKSHKPIAYITGEKEFYGLKFKLNEHTLIPRPETEFIVDEVISSGRKELLDLCTGSGCIPIAVAKNSGFTALGIDISPEAVEMATQNAVVHAVNDRVTFEIGNVLDRENFGKFDIITSNPPYITDSDMLTLSPDVADFEPHIALAGGSDGLTFYRRITEIAPQNLVPDGMLVFETGYDQAQAVAEIMDENFKEIKIIKDLSGIDRVVSGIVKETKYV